MRRLPDCDRSGGRCERFECARTDEAVDGIMHSESLCEVARSISDRKINGTSGIHYCDGVDASRGDGLDAFGGVVGRSYFDDVAVPWWNEKLTWNHHHRHCRTML